MTEGKGERRKRRSSSDGSSVKGYDEGEGAVEILGRQVGVRARNETTKTRLRIGEYQREEEIGVKNKSERETENGE